ncbi:zinc finger CCHC domain-containing protein 9 [Babesia gibsoni]|uniref:Zinc finger CCHC domain-containing protein 9 n=1 Tax=Babesia gibsoni TaxID=33632 RepID=A0AAD8LR63_BABGI|nr:zinc finger CCHC domain-containing protein 9 [Babesia gibsoni]
MPSKYNRTLSGCWDREKIEEAISSRQAELEGTEEKSTARIKFLKRKIAKLKKALKDGTPVGGNVLPRRIAKSKVSAPSGLKRSVSSRRIKKICFKCRKRGHTLQDCQGEEASICFRCGSKDHILRNCPSPDTGTLPYTSCFVCHKTGHIASQCPENENGIYPNGGCCFFCGSVEHRKVDCPERKKKS